MEQVETLINVNLAGPEALMRLAGVGEQLAQRIVAYREAERPFAEVMELTAVPGISERMVRAWEGQITVGAFAEPEMLVEVEVPLAAVDEVAVEPEVVVASEAASEPVVERPLSDPPAVAAPAALGRMVLGAETAVSRRRGCVYTVLAVLLGATLGVVATLGILAALNNGSLAFSRADAQIERELAGAQAAQGDLAVQVERLGEAVSLLATRTGEQVVSQAETAALVVTVQAEIVSMEEAAAETEAAVTALTTETVRLEEQIGTITVAAETFNMFLARLRGLLLELEVEETAVMATPTATPMVTATSMATTAATRTPRPTATPFVRVTATPVE